MRKSLMHMDIALHHSHNAHYVNSVFGLPTPPSPSNPWEIPERGPDGTSAKYQ